MIRAGGILHSLSLRLALLYAALFAVSMGVILYIIYSMNVLWPIDEAQRQIEAETSTVGATYMLEGPAAAARLLDRRARTISERKAYHLLVDARGRTLTTNLPSWPRRSAGGWIRIEADLYRDGEEDDRMALMLDHRLPDGARLAIGLDVEAIDQFGETLEHGALTVIGTTLIFGLLGGLVVSATIGRRIDAMSRTARRVIAGNLSERVPIRGTGDDFDALAATLNLMLSRIEDLIESVRRVSDSIAHELRTPLARLQADLEDLAQAGGDSDARGVLLEQAVSEAARLQSLFGALLRIARIESGRHHTALAPVDLAAIARDVIDLYGPEIDAKAIATEVILPDTLAIAGDADLLFQALSNIVDNAVKYSPGGGRITVRADAGELIRLSIRDTGPGVPAHLHARIFERFYRVPETAGADGAGLGLALVAAVVRLHGALIEVDPHGPGLAITMVFRRPLP